MTTLRSVSAPRGVIPGCVAIWLLAVTVPAAAQLLDVEVTHRARGLFPGEAQGDSYQIADAAPEDVGQTITITGYGVDDSPSSWNQTQQTHSGPYAGTQVTRVFYQVDTRGGNSG